MSELLPCPLCGGEAREHNRVNANTVTCYVCGLRVKQSGPGIGNAAKRWNHRHVPGQIKAEWQAEALEEFSHWTGNEIARDRARRKAEQLRYQAEGGES